MTIRHSTLRPSPPAHQHRKLPAFRAAGIGQLSLSVLAGLGLLAVAPGVAMCTDSGSTSYCSSVAASWMLSGVLLLGNLVMGVAMLCVNGSTSPRGRRGMAAASAVFALAALVCCTSLLHLTDQPIH